jgi:hypothetical protein
MRAIFFVWWRTAAPAKVKIKGRRRCDRPKLRRRALRAQRTFWLQRRQMALVCLMHLPLQARSWKQVMISTTQTLPPWLLYPRMSCGMLSTRQRRTCLEKADRTDLSTTARLEALFMSRCPALVRALGFQEGWLLARPELNKLSFLFPFLQQYFPHQLTVDEVTDTVYLPDHLQYADSEMKLPLKGIWHHELSLLNGSSGALATRALYFMESLNFF